MLRGLNDGACAILLASQSALEQYQLTAPARIVGTAVVGVEPRIMGIGPVPATQKSLAQIGWKIDEVDVIEVNEAFAAQALAVLRQLGLPDDAKQVNPNGGAIALGHPLGASGTRLVVTALRQLEKSGGRRGLITMCIGVGQGIALVLGRAK
jgi:acetyl-CoA acetyltransferase family protein